MAQQRQYESATVFNARAADMRHLWTPSTTYKGQQTQKPNYFGMWIVQKTQGHWSQEPVFAGVMGAFSKLLQGQLSAFAQNVNAVNWPIGDGDLPSAEGKSSEFAKGHWLFSASSGNPPNVELVQAGGTLVKLPNKVGVKSGDFCMLGLTAAVKQNDPRGVKFYLNAVVFTHPGEEIVFATSVSGAELMQQAQRQGLQVAGFSGSPGFGAPQQGGFAPQGGAGGFSPGQPQGPNPGFAPTTINTMAPQTPAFGGAPAPGGTPGGFSGNAISPSNQGQSFGVPQQGFATPNPFGQQR